MDMDLTKHKDEDDTEEMDYDALVEALGAGVWGKVSGGSKSKVTLRGSYLKGGSNAKVFFRKKLDPIRKNIRKPSEKYVFRMFCKGGGVQRKGVQVAPPPTICVVDW